MSGRYTDNFYSVMIIVKLSSYGGGVYDGNIDIINKTNHNY